MPRTPPVIEITPADFGSPPAELVLLCGPGRSGRNTLWTYGIVSENVLCSFLEVETHPTSGKIVKRTPIPRDACSSLPIQRAKQFGIDVPVSEHVARMPEEIRRKFDSIARRAQ